MSAGAGACQGAKPCLPLCQFQPLTLPPGGLERALLFIYLYVERDILPFLNAASLVSPGVGRFGVPRPGYRQASGAGAGGGWPPCRVGDPTGGAAVRADSRQSRRPQGLIVLGCAVPASQPCSLPPCRCPPPRGLQSPASGSHSSGLCRHPWTVVRGMGPWLGMGHGTPRQGWNVEPPARDGAGDPRTEMGQETPSH